MNISIFNWRDITHPQAGGAEAYYHEIARRLVEKGHHITLLCGAYEGCKKLDSIDGIRIIRFGGKYSIYLLAPLYYFKFCRNASDILVDSENAIPFFTPLFSRKPKVCVVHHVHLNVFDRELKFPLNALGKFLEGYLMPCVYKKVKFIVVSESTKEEVEKLGISDIRIIYNGVKIKNAKRTKKASSPLLLYFGRVKRYKRVDHAIKAFTKVRQAIPDARFIIAGRIDPDCFEELDDLLKSDVALEVKDAVSESDKIRLFSEAWVFVNPSMKEGWGVTVLEANACGTPAVAYDVPGLRNSIKHGYNGLLVEDGNTTALANAIIELLRNKELREKMSRQGTDWVKHFSWDKSAEEFEETLKSAVADN